MATTIQIEEKVKERLEKLKVHPKETFNQIIIRLIEYSEDDMVLSEETIKNIQEALEDIKSGRYYTHEEAKRKLGIE